ncbi:Hypothetical predicted protein [Podarcis lilfordi]|uniref:Uncharacterized protein n=1 Tax=Podarcis lilfordi TaxID=74358 RepID=A0AA35NW10_9SAUR|nr:Hypothetical predicted protein [Podarcis lilfordi]
MRLSFFSNSVEHSCIATSQRKDPKREYRRNILEDYKPVYFLQEGKLAEGLERSEALQLIQQRADPVIKDKKRDLMILVFNPKTA